MELAAGQTAVITGAGSGIGRALAMACAQRGLNVVAADLDAGRLESLASELNGIGGELLCQSVDVASRESISALAELAYQRFGQVELLFNNAGMLRSGRCWETSYEEWQRVMDVNVMSVLHDARHTSDARPRSTPTIPGRRPPCAKDSTTPSPCNASASTACCTRSCAARTPSRTATARSRPTRGM